MPITPFPDIQPFTWTQRWNRGVVKEIERLHQRYVVEASHRVGYAILRALHSGGRSFGYSLDQHPAVDRQQDQLTRLGAFNSIQYSLLQAITEAEPVWKEQVIVWAMETPHFDERHWKACSNTWIHSNSNVLSLIRRNFQGTCAMDLFDGEPRQRLMAMERAWAIKQGLETRVGQIKNDPVLANDRRM